MSIDTTGSAQGLVFAVDTVRQSLQTEQTNAAKVAEEVAQAPDDAAQAKQKVGAAENGRGAQVDVNV